MTAFDPTAFWGPFGAHLDAEGVPRRFRPPELESDALREGRAVRWQSRGDVLRIEGRDTLDLLHRIAASQVRDLSTGDAREVLFTNDKGRVLDLPVLVGETGGVLALCGKDQAQPLAAWLERYVITEDVRIERLVDAHVLTLVHAVDLAQTPKCVQARSRVAVFDTPSLAGWLDEHVPSPWTLVGEDAYRRWWIQAGALTAGPELSSGLNPLEAGLRRCVSWTKGCYIGQEVVARLDTYDKVRRHVVVLQGEALSDGETLRDADGRDAGRVLAAAQDEAGSWAMALVDKAVGEGDVLRTGSGAAGAVVKAPA